MARIRKPKEYPTWLFDPKLIFPFKKVCLWLCSVCGAPFYFPQPKGKHGGPGRRAGDRRYSAPFQGPCWRSHQYGVKCATPKGWRVLLHEGAPNPQQPEQPDAVWTAVDPDIPLLERRTRESRRRAT